MAMNAGLVLLLSEEAHGDKRMIFIQTSKMQSCSNDWKQVKLNKSKNLQKKFNVRCFSYKKC